MLNLASISYSFRDLRDFHRVGLEAPLNQPDQELEMTACRVRDAETLRRFTLLLPPIPLYSRGYEAECTILNRWWSVGSPRTYAYVYNCLKGTTLLHTMLFLHSVLTTEFANNNHCYCLLTMHFTVYRVWEIFNIQGTLIREAGELLANTKVWDLISLSLYLPLTNKSTLTSWVN